MQTNVALYFAIKTQSMSWSDANQDAVSIRGDVGIASGIGKAASLPADSAIVVLSSKRGSTTSMSTD